MSGWLKSGGWRVCLTALVSFACGLAVASRLTRVDEVRAGSNRVFELMVYHTKPGKVPALVSVFQNVSKLQAKHGLHAIGYWVPQDGPPAWNDTFVYLIADSSEADAQKHWDALHADPAFLPYRAAAVPLIQTVNGQFAVDEVFMQPTDFSAMK